jgi:hypothetical protein
MTFMEDWTTKINDSVAKSIVGRRFRLEGSGHVRAFSLPFPELFDSMRAARIG